MKIPSLYLILIIVLLAAFITGCQSGGIPREYLMPVPVLVTEGGANTAIIEAALADLTH